MKKIFILFSLILGMLMMSMQVNAKVVQKGNVLYEYKSYGKGVWLYEITLLSTKGIKSLKIPEKLGGKKVIKMTGVSDGEDGGSNIFGVYYNDDLGKYMPVESYNRVKSIRKIIVPDTVETISDGCFGNIPNEKKISINIPQKIDFISGIRFLNSKWEKITVSKKNKYYKSINDCLLTKDGKEFCGILKDKNRVIIPNGVKKIPNYASFRKTVKKIEIPKTVVQLNFNESISKDVEVSISKKNKKYAVSNGSVYNKITKCLIFGKTKKSICVIPEQVETIGDNSYLGEEYPSKIVISQSVKMIKMITSISEKENLTLVCNGKKPPELIGTKYSGPVKNILVFVPNGCVDAYKNAWKVDCVELQFVELSLPSIANNSIIVRAGIFGKNK